MSENSTPVGGVLRRTILKASAATAGALAVSTTATADEHDDTVNADDDTENDVDEPDGFDVEIVEDHAPFVDDVATTFEITYPDADEPVVVEFDDAATVVTAEATWEEGAESGWHRHPGMSIVQMVEGEIEHMMDDCVPRTYSAGDAWIDPGHVHRADSEEGAFARITFLGTPEGEPLTEWVEPVDC